MNEHEQSILDEIRKPDVRWHSITSKYGGKCIECNQPISKGDDIVWTKTQGAKHQTCPTSPSKNYDLVVIDENSDKPKTWLDPKKYSYQELQEKKKCQYCGVDIIKESYIDNDRKVCSNCYLI